MRVFKGYVKNQNRPEGCIAQCCIVEEAIEFCSEFLLGLGTIRVPPATEDNKPLGGSDFTKIDQMFLNQAYLCVLHNTNVVQSYIK